MANINSAASITKRSFLANISNNSNEQITPLFSGFHGIGKSSILKLIADQTGWICDKIDGTTMKEGDITGYPQPFKDEDGTLSLNFIKHYVFDKVAKLQKKYYEIAKTKGFLGGALKIDDDGNEICTLKGHECRIAKQTEIHELYRGETNMYQFGEKLPGEIKAMLVSKKEIVPVIIMIDELNRADDPVLKELMNILLNKKVNDFEIPWWVQFIGAENPVLDNGDYKVTEKDPANIDRFMLISFIGDADEWISYARNKDLNEDMIYAIGVEREKYLNCKIPDSVEKGSPSQRSMELVSNILSIRGKFYGCGILTDKEKDTEDTQIREMVIGKIGSNAAYALFREMENQEERIIPTDIFSCDRPNIKKDVKEKFKSQSSIRRKLTVDAIVTWLAKNYIAMKDAGTKDIREKTKFDNFTSQFREFVSEEFIDDSMLSAFQKNLSDRIMAYIMSPLGNHDMRNYVIIEDLSKFYKHRTEQGIEFLKKNLTDM